MSIALIIGIAVIVLIVLIAARQRSGTRITRIERHRQDIDEDRNA